MRLLLSSISYEFERARPLLEPWQCVSSAVIKLSWYDVVFLCVDHGINEHKDWIFPQVFC